MPGRDESPPGLARNIHIRLVVGHAGVDQKLVAGGGAIGIEALPVDTPARAILAARLPHDDEAAAVKARNGRRILLVGRVAVDLELAAHRHAVGIVTLAIDAIGPTILRDELGCLDGRPHDHVTAIGQRGHGRFDLSVGLVGVDLLVGTDRLGTVVIRIDRDLDHLGHAGAASAVIDADADGAGSDRSRGSVGVGEVFDQRLDGGWRGRPVELNDQVCTVGAAGGDTTDHHATIGDVAATDADLASSAALIADAELILGGNVFRQLGVEDVAIAGDNAYPQGTAGEVGGVGIHQIDARIDDLRCHIDYRFVKSDRGGQVEQFRSVGTSDAAAGIEELVEHTVGVDGAGLLLVVAGPTDDEALATEGGNIRLVLNTGNSAIDNEGAVDLVASAVELLGEDIVGTAAQTVVTVPGNHETAIVQGIDTRVVLVGPRVLRRHDQLSTSLVPAGVKALGVDVVVVLPYGNETTIR